MRRFLPLLSLALLGALAPAALADTIRVPDDVATIQAAVDAAQPGDEIVIHGLHFENVLVQGKTDLVIRGVRGAVIDGSLENGLTYEGLEIEFCHGITVRGLTVKNTRNDMILVQDSAEVVIDRCTVIAGEEHDSDGIGVQRSHDVTIEHCRAIGVDNDGIYMNAERGVVRRNRIESSRGTGIRLAANAADCIVERSRVRDTEGPAIEVRGEGNTIRRNALKGANEVGVHVRDGVHLVTDNRIAGTLEDGLYIESDGCTVAYNRVKRAGRSGLVIDSRLGLYESNVIRRSTRAGISLSGRENLLRRNRARGSGSYDLDDNVGGVGNTFEDNDFPTQSAAD